MPRRTARLAFPTCFCPASGTGAFRRRYMPTGKPVRHASLCEENSRDDQQLARSLQLRARRMFNEGQSDKTNLPKENITMTAALYATASMIASVIPGFLISPHDPAAILGFATVGALVLLAARDYVMPRKLTKHGVRI